MQLTFLLSVYANPRIMQLLLFHWSKSLLHDKSFPSPWPVLSYLIMFSVNDAVLHACAYILCLFAVILLVFLSIQNYPASCSCDGNYYYNYRDYRTLCLQSPCAT